MARTWKELARSVGRSALRATPKALRAAPKALRGAPGTLREAPGALRQRLPGQRPRPAARRATSAAAAAARLNGGAPQVKPAPNGRHLAYAPDLDGQADPGEIVWTWVPYEDDPHQGKDRPVLVTGRQGTTLLGLMLSSQSERDGQRHWFALGEGNWDREHRPSWIRLDRVIEVDEDGIRREGAILDRARFDLIAAQLRTHYGWT